MQLPSRTSAIEAFGSKAFWNDYDCVDKVRSEGVLQLEGFILDVYSIVHLCEIGAELARKRRTVAIDYRDARVRGS